MSTTLNGWPRLSQVTYRSDVGVEGYRPSSVNAEVAAIFEYLVKRWNKEIEPVTMVYGGRGEELNRRIGGHPDSNHVSGTAWDINGHKHGYEKSWRSSWGPYTDGFTEKQRQTLRKIAADIGIVRLGIDFKPGWRDGMHVELANGTTMDDVRKALQKINGTTPAPPANKLKPKVVYASADRHGTHLTKLIQEWLGLKQDGKFGANTKAGVAEKQKSLNLKPDGVWGPATQRAFFYFWINRYGRSLRKGDRGIAVKFLQYILSADRDGVWGADTDARLKAAQRWGGLKADALFGRNSVNRLVR